MLGAHLTPGEYLRRCSEEFDKLDLTEVERLGREIFAAYEEGRFVFICGNGGSGSNSSHFCEDLGKSSLDPADFTNDAVKRLKVLSLTDNTPYILAWGNDEGFDRIPRAGGRELRCERRIDPGRGWKGAGDRQRRSE